MTIILQDNSLLTWLQDQANNNYQDKAALTEVYSFFAGHKDVDNPLIDFI